MTIGVAVPVLNNFKGFTQLVASIDVPFLPYVVPNWDNNIGVGPGWNMAIESAIADGIQTLLVVNDDVIFRPGAIENMKFWSSLGHDVVSPQNETGVCHPHGLNFWCFMIRPDEFVEKFGWFDENFAPAYYEDDDMAYRIKLAGGNIHTTDDRIYHAVMGSEVDPSVTAGNYQKNYNYYIEKWGGYPQAETFTHPYNDDRFTLKEWRK